MIIDALTDILEAFVIYSGQAFVFGFIGVIVFTAWEIIKNIVRFLRKKKCKNAMQMLNSICLFAVFCIYYSYVLSLTISGRDAGSRSDMINLKPLSTLFEEGTYSFTIHGIENILLFIPMGLLVPLLWKYFSKVYMTGLLGLIASMSIELIQLITGRGAFELDDIILNTLGALIGYAVFFILKELAKMLLAIRKALFRE